MAAYVEGEKVVDLWGGVRDGRSDDPWEEDTLVIVYSTSKGLSAMTLALAHSRGWLDYDQRVVEYWPEFAKQGKGGVTVRQLLGHEAGLPVIDERLDPELLQDFDRLGEVIARQKPLWKPGTRHGYHGISLGWYMGELMRRVDPQKRTLGRFFAEELAGPLGLDVLLRAAREHRPRALRAHRARQPAAAGPQRARPAAAHGDGDGQPALGHLQDLRQPARVVARRPRQPPLPQPRVPRRRRAGNRALGGARLRRAGRAEARARLQAGDARGADPLPRAARRRAGTTRC